MRLRTAKDRLKIEHSIIDGVRNVLETLLAATPAIRSVIPGVIRPVRDAKGKGRMRITVPTQNGWKAIALSAGARQELFISTDVTKEEEEAALVKAGAAGRERDAVLGVVQSKTASKPALRKERIQPAVRPAVWHRRRIACWPASTGTAMLNPLAMVTRPRLPSTCALQPGSQDSSTWTKPAFPPPGAPPTSSVPT